MRGALDAPHGIGVEAASIPSYTPGMKTAISIPDDVFTRADALARELKQSRSQLYTRAVREYVARHSADEVTAALNAMCDQVAAEAVSYTHLTLPTNREV